MLSNMHIFQRSSVLFTVLLLFSGCQKGGYNGVAMKEEMDRSSGGAYTKVIRKTTGTPITGELIFLDDTLILRTDRNQYTRLPVDDIRSMTSQVSGTKTKTYLLITGLTLIPLMVGLLAHDHKDSPKAIGLMATTPGFAVALIESFKKPQIISYPDDTPLQEFKRHARFPESLPFDDPKLQDLVSSASIKGQGIDPERIQLLSSK